MTDMVERSVVPRQAAKCLLAGGLVALPTETVYGLGALADDQRAVARVYAVKGRPADHPLIVHVGSADGLASWGSEIRDYALALAHNWPAPLTLVVRRSERAQDWITGGQDTVAIRVPDHPLFLETLAALDELEPSRAPHGIAAPSANRFGAVSPTTADHVEDLADFLDSDDLILDGGPCGIGIESTIVDCTGEIPRILRAGAFTAEDVERITGIPCAATEKDHVTDVPAVRAPGMLESHYAPETRVQLVAADDIEALAAGFAAGTVGLIADASVKTPMGAVRLAAPQDADAYARELYAAFREADALGLALVLAVAPIGAGIADGVRDRLTRAAH